MIRRGALDLGVLAALGAGVVAVTAWTATWTDTRAHAGAFATAMVAGLVLWAAAGAWVLRRRPGGWMAVGLVLVVALGARAVLVPVAPDVSGDINRYVWDGRVQAEGINPYRFPPDHPRLAPLRDDAVYPGINRKPVNTIYPPVAEATFLGLHLAGARGVTTVKLALAVVDGLTVLLLAMLLSRLGRAPSLALLYAWHPLAILEVGRSGHVEALAVALLLGALLAHLVRRPLAAGALLAGATLVKFYAATILPALLWVGGRRSPRPVVAFALTAVAAYLPYLGVGTGVLGYLPGYLEEEGFESGGRFYLLDRTELLLGDLSIGPVAAGTWYPAAVALVLGAIVVRCVRRPPPGPQDVVDRAMLLLLALMLLSSPTYPWYLLTLLALVPLASAHLAVPAAVACAGGGFLYLQWWLESSPSWPLDLTWGLGLLSLIVAVALRRTATWPSSPGRLRRWPVQRADPGRADDGTRTHDLLHGKQTL